MKKLVNKQNASAFMVVMAITALMLVVPESAQAQNVGKVISDGTFKPIISFGLGLYAAWKWFEYFANFAPRSAFTDIIVPAIITFLAFKWADVLKWMTITSA